MTLPNYNGFGTGEIATVDCNGAVQALHFAVSPSNATLQNLDFYICQPAISCHAAFVASTISGQTSVQFSDYSTTSLGTITQWIWFTGDGDTLYGQFPTHNYASTGPFTVCLAISTSTGCIDSTCQTVLVGSGAGNCSSNLTYGLLASGAIGPMLRQTNSPTFVLAGAGEAETNCK